MQLLENSVHIWTIHLPQNKRDLSEYASILSTTETKRARSFLSNRDRESYTLARGGLRSILSEYLGLPAKDIKLSCHRYGKPKITGKVGQGLEFNLSHSGDYALCAVTKNTPVGIDIEKVQARNPAHYVRLANRFFSENEADVIRNAPMNEVASLFFSCWTRKEAYVKQHGLGLRLPLRNFTVNVDYRKRARLENTPWHPSDVEVTRIYDLQVASGYFAAYSIASTKSVRVGQYTKSPLM